MVRIASVCDTLDVLAQQYSAIGDRIHSGVMALHRGCEVSRRLAEIAGIGRVGATTLVAEIVDWKIFSSRRGLAALNSVEEIDHRRQGFNDPKTAQPVQGGNGHRNADADAQ